MDEKQVRVTLLTILCKEHLKANQLHQNIDWQQHDKRELNDISEETRHGDFVLFGDGFYHEVGPVADVGHCAKEDGADGDTFHDYFGSPAKVVGRGG